MTEKTDLEIKLKTFHLINEKPFNKIKTVLYQVDYFHKKLKVLNNDNHHMQQ